MNRSDLMLMALSGILLCILPSAAAFTLDIFGNANMDDTINADDIAYLQGIINGTNKETELADANYDGKIDQLDVSQIEEIIRGVEKNLTIIQYIKPSSAPEIARTPVKVPLPIESIAALSGTYGPEMLCVLGDADKIVAVTDTAANRGEIREMIKDKPGVGATFEWDMEKVLQIKPDVVLGYASYDYSEQRKILDASGITLIQMNFNRPEVYAGEARNLGWLLGKKDRVEELIDFEDKHLNLIEERVKGLTNAEKPRVYAESYKDLQYSAGSTSITAAIKPCGGINIFEELKGSNNEIDPEQVITDNPQVILKMTSHNDMSNSGFDAVNTTQMAAKVLDIVNRTGWNNIDAVKDGRVCIITSDAASIHPSIFNSYVAKWLHPDLFKDMDPLEIHKEWQQKFLGIEFKGVYAYPLQEES
ncbi:MAG: ABC transporter substrate-binding protein [Methanothrix sp.]|nr:ABC transporter substrate-binding protein [Methanothrix sp.]